MWFHWIGNEKFFFKKKPTEHQQSTGKNENSKRNMQLNVLLYANYGKKALISNEHHQQDAYWCESNLKQLR